MARAKVPARSAACVVLSTVGELKNAKQIAQTLIQHKLAACVNILPKVSSLYRWQGKVHVDAEILLIIKTRRLHVAAIKKLFKTLHPYDVPELIAVPIVDGSTDYLTWLAKETQPKLGK